LRQLLAAAIANHLLGFVEAIGAQCANRGEEEVQEIAGELAQRRQHLEASLTGHG